MENLSDWMIDREACTATHDSGLVVRFRSAPDGVIDGFPTNKADWLFSFPSWEQDMVLSLFPALMGQGAQAYCQSLARRN